MTRNIFSLLTFFFAAIALHAQDIYLKVEGQCMTRLEYSSGSDAQPYLTYSFKLGDKKFAMFDVGIESTETVQDLRAKLTSCYDLKVDRNLVQAVNSGERKLYFVREAAAHYHIDKASKANFMETHDGGLEYVTDDAAFVLYFSNLVSDVNLAKPGSKSEIYLSGTANYQCLKGYVLQKKENAKSANFKEYVLVPELGMVERSAVSGSSTFDSGDRINSLKLNKVGDSPFKKTLEAVCDKVQAGYYDGLATTDTPKSYDALTQKSGAATVPTSYGAGDPCAPSTEPGLYVVQKGETLYGISKRYGVTVAQLQEWNNLVNSNVISLCQKIWVKQPGATTGTGTTTEKGTDTPTTGSAGYWTKPAAEHVVRYGETVSSLASMYGYTEDRFRKMNGLSATEQLRVGQRLNTNDCICPTLESTTKDKPLPYEAPTEAIETKPVNNQDVYFRPITVHQVKGDETLFSIAKQYNTTVERILELNGMKKGDKLTPNQKIYVQ